MYKNVETKGCLMSFNFHDLTKKNGLFKILYTKTYFVSLFFRVNAKLKDLGLLFAIIIHTYSHTKIRLNMINKKQIKRTFETC